jgi:CAAX protease family protein
MNPTTLFINPQTKLLRSPWRILVFVSLSPQILLLTSPDRHENRAGIEASFPVISGIAIYLTWTILLSWFCLRFFDHLSLGSLGFSVHKGWARHILTGSLIGALMTVAVVVLQICGGGTRVSMNDIWWRGGAIDFYGLQTTVSETLAALVLLIFAGSFEELTFRGYPFQTLLRCTPAVIPILLFSLYFGISHGENPGTTFLSTVNTVLAGIWFSVAYLKTRSLWFTSSLHFTWNWMLGPFFGLPVSGYRIPRHPIFISTSESPIWLTGGDYGSEGGVAATFVIIIATIFIWKKVSSRQSAVGSS